MLKIFSGNRLERLVDDLITNMDNQKIDVFEPRIVIVQSKGMERWLNLRIAEKLGIAANIEFPFPKKFMRDVLKDGPDDRGLFEPEVMTWMLYRELDENHLKDDIFKPLIDYIESRQDRKNRAPDLIKRFQLAGQLAGIFDNYMQFRPNMILEWMGERRAFNDPVPKVDAHGWQKELWNRLVRHEGKNTLMPMQLAKFLGKDLKTVDLGLPEQVHVFGLSALSPLYMTSIHKLAERVDVNIYFLNPCRKFWEDTVTEKKRIAEVLRAPDTGELWDVGNPILSSMGMLSRDFSRILNGLDNVGTHEAFEDPGTKDMLHTMQHRMLRLESPPEDPDDQQVIGPDDHSIQVHVCHSRMREVEVLHDRLLDMLEADRGLQPRDILVMTPDIAKYVPYINAKFGNPESEKKRIPFSIADRTPTAENPVARALLDALALADSRYTVEDVLGLFDVPAVYKNFGIREADLELIHEWIQESAARWGIDKDFRKHAVGIGFDQNSWHFARERLLLGYAMTSDSMWEGISPVDIATSNAETLGRFLRFLDKIEGLWRERGHTKERPPKEWQGFLIGLMYGEAALFTNNKDTRDDLLDVTRVIDALTRNMELAGIKTVPAEVMLAALTRDLEGKETPHGFLLGGVTFCRLRPMRSIPARVICLIGMDDGAFPRTQKNLGLDLIANNPRPGDRNPRYDDRNLFMEALVSARDRLYISYVGHSIKDNSDMPPSVLVSELFDYLKAEFKTGNDKSMEDLVITEHPLQAFSQKYFDQKNELFSFSKMNCEGAKAMTRAEPGNPHPTEWILQGKNCDPKTMPNLLPPAQLLRFMKNPVKDYLVHQASVYPEMEDVWIPEINEPMSCDKVDYFLKAEVIDAMLDALLNAGDMDRVKAGYMARLSAWGKAPVGTVGKNECKAIMDELAGFADMVKDQGLDHRQAVAVDVKVNDIHLKGMLKPAFARDTPLMYRYSQNLAAILLDAWVNGLVLRAGGYDFDGLMCVYKGGTRSLEIPDKQGSMARLKDLVDLYCEGMTTPLPFFVRTSYAYATTMDMKKTMETWSPSWQGSFAPESGDAYISQVFPEDFFVQDDLRKRFQELAIRVFEPIIKATKKPGSKAKQKDH